MAGIVFLLCFIWGIISVVAVGLLWMKEHMNSLLCLIFHDWWDSRHRVWGINAGMGQMMYCSKYDIWRWR